MTTAARTTEQVEYPLYIPKRGEVLNTAKAGYFWKAIDDKTVEVMFEQGCTIKDIADAVQRTPSAVIERMVAQRMLNRRGVESCRYEYKYYVRDSWFTQRSVPNPFRSSEATQPQPQPKETKMAITIRLEQQTLVNNKPLSDYTDEQLYSLLETTERQIAKWEGIEHKPKKLARQIEEAKAACQALANLIDAQDAEKGGVK